MASIPVKRVTRKKYDEVLRQLSRSAKFVRIPSTIFGVEFDGIYSDIFGNEIIVPWPVDRPQAAQDDFAIKYKCGYPQESIEVEKKTNPLKVVKE